MNLMQRAVEIIYPNQCTYCDAPVEKAGGLCAGCWREATFTSGHKCDLCAVPLPGTGDGLADLCDDCLTHKRPWSHGRAALWYQGLGRKVVLSLKYGDRVDVAAAAARWMLHAGTDIVSDDTVFVPVPAHWRRLVRRRYNPAVELVKELGALRGCGISLDALVRHRATSTQKGRGVEARFLNVDGSISLHPKNGAKLKDRKVCVVDDTMASGATLTEACQAVSKASPKEITVLVLAKAVKASYL